MAPALTKVMKDGHGIHLSSPLAPERLESDGTAMQSTELESQVKSTGDGDLHNMWLNLPSIPSLDSFLPVSPLDVPANPLLSPCLQASAIQHETMLLPGPASLLNLLPFNEGLKDSHQVASVFPGVPDMFFVPVHNSQEACLLHGSSAAPECGPDGGDVQPSPLTIVSQSYFQGEIKHRGSTPVSLHPPALTQDNVAGIGCVLPSSVQLCSGRVNSELPTSRHLFDEAVKEQLCRQAGLQSRGQRLQRRLLVLLGEQSLLHCNQQLEGLKRHCQLEGVSLGTPDSIYPGALHPEVGYKSQYSSLESSTASSSLTELIEFSCSSQAVLRSLQEALDSEATASSSSSDEEDTIQSKTKTPPVGSLEMQWLEARAELGSRWSWLQLRVSQLEGKIQQLVELHKLILSNKGGVVLAESQPLTDKQIQQTLLREMVGLSCTASDADAEHCSPTRLLHNIERQSAQLSQIVSSLMPPLSCSPLSKQHTCKGMTALTSGQRGASCFMPGSPERKRLGTRRRLKADASCVCARTRPLVGYHKRKLFRLSSCNPGSPQDFGKSTTTLSSSSCSCCSSCDPDCSASKTTRTGSSTSHPALSLSFDTHLFHRLKRAPAREEWCQRPLVVSGQRRSPAHDNRCSSTPLHSSHKLYKQHARRHKRRVLGLSPIRKAGSAERRHREANQRKKKRRRVHRLIKDEEDLLYQLFDSSDEVWEQSYEQATRKHASQGFVRKRQGVSEDNINDIVIPMFAAKVEKLQYKDILTPSWRVVDASPLINREAEDNEEGQLEDFADEVFAQRHLAFERREKFRRGSWEKRRCCRRPKRGKHKLKNAALKTVADECGYTSWHQNIRSSSRLSGRRGGMCTSGEESSVEPSCAQLDADEQQSSEEWLPRTPWVQRVFPLDEAHTEALLSDDTGECSSAFTRKNSKSQLSPA